MKAKQMIHSLNKLQTKMKKKQQLNRIFTTTIKVLKISKAHTIDKMQQIILNKKLEKVQA